MPNPAAALATFKVAWTLALPYVVRWPVLERPPVPFTVKVSADVMPALPIEIALPLVLVFVSVPADRHAAAAGAANAIPVELQRAAPAD